MRAITEALNRQDFDGAMELCAPDVEFDWSRRLLDPVVLTGRDEMAGFMREVLELFDQVVITNEEYLEFGDDTVLTSGSARFKGRSSGVDVQASAAQIWRLRDGEVVSFCFYQSKEEALAALDARERGSVEAD